MVAKTINVLVLQVVYTNREQTKLWANEKWMGSSETTDEI